MPKKSQFWSKLLTLFKLVISYPKVSFTVESEFEIKMSISCQKGVQINT